MSRSGLAAVFLVARAIWLPGEVAPQAAAPIREAAVEVTFIDVGNADAVVVRAPEGQTALIDAGESSPLVLLRVMGVRQIDLLIATHPHADHIGGMADVIDGMPVRYFMDNGQPYTTETYRELIRTLERRSSIVYLEAEPRTISLGSVELDVLSLPPEDTQNVNNNSVAIVVRFGSFRALLSGDSQTEELTWLLDQGVVPDVTLLKAPHHGSSNGFTPDFLRASNPEAVVISAGRGNSYGHPHAEALAAYEEVSDHLYRTDLQSHVTVMGARDGRYDVYGTQGHIASGMEREERGDGRGLTPLRP